jgi:hypothetical protein
LSGFDFSVGPASPAQVPSPKDAACAVAARSKVTMRGVQQKKKRLNTDELPAFIDAFHLHSQHRAFDREMHFPFLGIHAAPDAMRYRGANWPKDRPSQVIDVSWYNIQCGGRRPYFTCPHCKLRRVKLFDAGGFLTCRVCCNLRYRTQQSRRRACLRIKAKKIRARLNAADSEPGEPWPAKPYLMSRKVYRRHIRQLMKVEAAIFSMERTASPRYRRWRSRNLDGSFVTK